MKTSSLISLALLTAAAVSAYDDTVAFTGGDLVGEITLNGKPDLKVRADLAEGVMLPGDLKIAHVGLPNFVASCSYSQLAGLVFSGSAVPLGRTHYPVPWAGAPEVPDDLVPLDSVIDQFPDFTHRDRFLGKGILHTSEDVYACKTINVNPMAGYDQLIFFRDSSSHLFIKLQIQALRTDTETCRSFANAPCSQANAVVVRYHITDNPGGMFKQAIAGMHKPALAPVRPQAARRVYDLILGRNPAARRGR
jgi:hypothetical protein